MKHGFLYQGQYYLWQKKRRGTRTKGIPPEAFVTFLENHDQVANNGGQRLWQLTSPARYRALTALLLLSPGRPMLFQGQEFASSRPFFCFADHKPELARLRFFGEDGDDRLLLINLGMDVLLAPTPQPLLAPDEGREWKVLWNSEDPRYGGDSAVAAEREDGWLLPGESAVVMKAAVS